MCVVGLGNHSKVAGIAPSKLGMLSQRLLDHRLLQRYVAEAYHVDIPYVRDNSGKSRHALLCWKQWQPSFHYYC